MRSRSSKLFAVALPHDLACLPVRRVDFEIVDSLWTQVAFLCALEFLNGVNFGNVFLLTVT